MNVFAKLFRAHRETNLVTAFARGRMEKAMPGEAAALASVRLGCMSL